MRPNESTTISVEINRFGDATRTLSLREDATIKEALTSAGIRELSSTEYIWVNGEKATENDILDDGDVIQIVGKKEGGAK